jgi:hypothetical protein
MLPDSTYPEEITAAENWLIRGGAMGCFFTFQPSIAFLL